MTARLHQLSVALLFGGCALVLGGCAAGGLAAVSPLLAAVQLVSDRRVERTVAADLPTSVAVTEQAFVRMAISIESSASAEDAWMVRGAGKNLTIVARLEPATAHLTKIWLSVEAGRLTADKSTGEAIQNEIARLLAERTPAEPRHQTAAPAVSAPDAVATLESEVKQLRLKLEQRSSVAPPTGAVGQRGGNSGVTFDGGAILSVPVSYGVASPVVPVTNSPPVPITVTPTAAESTSPSVHRLRTTPLKPATSLTPVQPLGTGD